MDSMGKRIAVIDMGTNTFHILIAEVLLADFKTIYKEKVAVRIGKGGISHGKITSDAQKRALDTLIYFKNIADKEGASGIYATATSAIRNATNGQELCENIKKQTGIEVNIISGDREAELIYYGVNKALRLGEKPGLIMDIGGGSVEFIIGTDKQILWKYSFEIGAQRLLDKFQNHDPILDSEIKDLNLFLKEQLKPLIEACSEFSPETLIGSSGTFDTLSDIYLSEKNEPRSDTATELPFSLHAFEKIYQQIISKNKTERLQIPGMIEMRVDMIVVACCLVQFIIENCGIKEMRVSAYALKEGVILHTIESFQNKS